MASYIELISNLLKHYFVYWKQQFIIVHHVLKRMSCQEAILLITGIFQNNAINDVKQVSLSHVINSPEHTYF